VGLVRPPVTVRVASWPWRSVAVESSWTNVSAWSQSSWRVSQVVSMNTLHTKRSVLSNSKPLGSLHHFVQTSQAYHISSSPEAIRCMRAILIQIPNRNRNRFCTSHTQCVTVTKCLNFEIVTSLTLVFLNLFYQNRFGRILFTIITNGHKFKCEWCKSVSVSVSIEMVRNERQFTASLQWNKIYVISILSN